MTPAPAHTPLVGKAINRGFLGVFAGVGLLCVAFGEAGRRVPDVRGALWVARNLRLRRIR